MELPRPPNKRKAGFHCLQKGVVEWWWTGRG